MTGHAGSAASSMTRKSILLKEHLELEKEITSDGKKKFRIKPIEEELSFDKGFFVFIRAIQLLTSHDDGTIVIGLAGPSGSGKTAFSEKVSSFLPGVCVISMDNYNDGSKVIDSNFDDPRLADYDLLLKNIEDLKNGKPAEVPIYDFKKSSRVGYRHVEVPKSRVVIIEGIYALNERLRDLLDFRVSITGGIHFDLIKRVLRDLNRSGLQADTIIQQISDTVYPMYKAFIEPDLKTAHLKIHNNFNPFSGFICNPVYILKSSKELTTESLLSVLDEEKVERTESSMTDIYLLPPNEDPEQCSNWLRMRSRDGRYSLMFEEWVTEVPFVISPRISFEVSVRILGGLMALGYEIGPILRRRSIVYSDNNISIKQDTIEKLGKFVQIQGDSRDKVAEIGKKLGLDGHYIPRSYIEQVQLKNLVAAFKSGDLSEYLGSAADAALSHDLSSIPQLKTEDHRFTNNQQGQKLQSASSLPARLDWTHEPVDISIKKSSSANDRTSLSDEGGTYSRNSLQQELRGTIKQTTDDQEDSASDGVPASLELLKTDTLALVHSLQHLTEKISEVSLNQQDPFVWASVGCVCFLTGVLTGLLLAKH